MSRTHAPHRNSSRVFDRGALGTEDLGRLSLRLALGGVLLAHGLQKFTVMGVDQVGQFFASLGLPAPELAAALVSTLELVGGAALVLGVLVRPIAVLAAAELAVASLTAHTGFFADAGGWELPGVIALSLLGLALLGGGKLTVLGALVRRIPPLLR
ncbi:hypothetical protein FM113_08580 [Leucobacter sp. 7(1)]|uniref:DoxX family protein n=1 Tax=Leucobacter sp. 7(1) TaxID=1255613 RepID=UPI00097EDCE6|nr:DoxX family protein [Leucobacter sp. 7(1)]SJN10229.1 hypothetical protein FM113_08580 [Leucobacter sp. 7(1)]